MLQKTIALIASSWLVTTVAFAQTVDQQDTAVATNLGLYGVELMDLTTDPNSSDYVFVSSYTPNGIFTSSNGGDTWQGLPSDVDYGAGKDVAIDPVNGDVYGLIGDDVIKSTDHGETWDRLTPNLVDNPIMGSVALYANDTLLVSVTGGELQYSTDGGETFTAVSVNGSTDNSSSVYVVSLAANSAGTFYAILTDETAETSALYISSDGGASWSEMDVTAGGVEAGARFYDIAVDPASDDHLVLASYHPDYDSYHSLNGGTTWLALQNDEERLGANEAVFNGAGNLYIGLYFTEDPQSISPTWTAIETDTPLSSVRGDYYAVDYTNPLTLYSNTGLGIAKSEDGGSTWIDTVDGITALRTYSISQADDKDVVWIGANGGLARSTNFTDDNPDWDFPILPEDGISSVQAVWVKPDNANRVIAGLSGFISLSIDGGDTWEHADTPDFTGSVEQIVQSPRSEAVLYALYTNTSLTEDAFNGGVLKSTDAGSTWEDLDFPSTLAGGAIAVAVADDKDILYVGIGSGGSETGVYSFANDDWEKLAEDFNGLNVNYILVHPADNAIVFVSCEADSTVGGLFKSTDSGANWETLTDGLDDMNHLGVMTTQGANSETLYLVGQVGGSGEGIILKSTDQGESWSQ
ncbi:MAG TPA: hypothetical protein DEG44_05230, partial [Candidatus Kerfeldbacteria bacterium]|nr:hypothetical protein [Candidatus Kerfeldbacteria bacterium]